MNRFRIGVLLVAGLGLAVVAPLEAGVVKGTARAVRAVAGGVASDARTGVKIGSYPVRHPRKTAHGVGKAAKAVAHAAVSL